MSKGIPINGINKGWFKKGHKPKAPFKEGQVSLFKGKHHSLESRKKLSESAKKSYVNGRVHAGGWPIGRKHTEIEKSKIRLASKGKPKWWMEGDKNPKWKGGVSPINHRIRGSIDYALWRTAVFMRDNYTCQKCGHRGGDMHADHIKPFSLYPELRLAIDNGRTLCVECHRQTETYGNKIYLYKEVNNGN